jgi:putative hydrolase of HD superfamily
MSDPAGAARTQEQVVHHDMNEIEQILTFLRAAERLKTVLRSGWTSAGQRESVAEHTWRLCLMAFVFTDRYPKVDFAKLIKICIIHDLGEALGGDIPAPEQEVAGGKAPQERADLLELVQPLPAYLQQQIMDLWDEYEAATSPEAKLAKALDKLETIMQHNQGKNPADFDYRFNLDYGRRYTEIDPLLAAVRARLDLETAERAEKSDPNRSTA